MVQMQQVKHQNNTQSPSKANKTAHIASHQAISFIWHTCNPYLSAKQKADQRLGIIAQRMPSLSWRASDLNDKGYTLTEIDPLTGQQKLPYRRFDDDNVPFSSDPAAHPIDLSDPAQRQNLPYALLTAAQERGAIAPMWEVNTDKMQANAGAVNAGLSEEERAAKAGYAAPVDAAYVTAHQADYAGKPAREQKRVGSFMTVYAGAGDEYSQKRSALSPYDGDIMVKKLENWKLDNRTGQQHKQARASARSVRIGKPVLQIKKWQCQRTMVIVCCEKSSEFIDHATRGVAQ